jgi:hypothetical protein
MDGKKKVFGGATVLIGNENVVYFGGKRRYECFVT